MTFQKKTLWHHPRCVSVRLLDFMSASSPRSCGEKTTLSFQTSPWYLPPKEILHPGKLTNSSPKKGASSIGNIHRLQPSIFRGHSLVFGGFYAFFSNAKKSTAFPEPHFVVPPRLKWCEFFGSKERNSDEDGIQKNDGLEKKQLRAVKQKPWAFSTKGCRLGRKCWDQRWSDQWVFSPQGIPHL